MELISYVPSQSDKKGEQVLEMTSPQGFKIVHRIGGGSPDEVLLQEICPAGKRWVVRLFVVINEYPV
jgi:hypothetical protein